MSFRELQDFESEIVKLLNRIQLLHLCHHSLCQPRLCEKWGLIFTSSVHVLRVLHFSVFSCFWLQSKVSNTTPKRGSVSAVLVVPVEAVLGVQ